MLLQDDRTPEQHKTHRIIIMMTDRFLSGWGQTNGGPSYAGWACKPEDASEVESWVRSRSDAMRVRIVGGDYRSPSITGHCHIYVCPPDGPLD